MGILYFDCFSGMSGDMVIGALIDAGADPEFLKEELKKLHIDEEYDISWEKVNKNGITSTKFHVDLHNEDDEHTHHHHDGDHGHSHHHHDHSHDHHHAHRSYKDIVKLIQGADFSDSVIDLAIHIFTRIGKAEGLIHGQPLDTVHFHEVGAVDSIIDIVGTAILIDQLNVKQIISAPVPVGSGHIHIDHGTYPIPAPATLEILRGIPLAESVLKSELTTPTGAAIAAELATEFRTLPAMKVNSIGYGAGTKTFPEHPNVLRVVIGEK